MKFDFVIGNPPYQEHVEDNGRQNPIYHKFMEAAYSFADTVELITPARFLFDAGQTPKEWNQKMLNDEHLKPLMYEADASKIFPNTDIKGGVVITIRCLKKDYGKIGVFTISPELDSIIEKVIYSPSTTISNIITGAVPYRFTQVLKDEHPEYVSLAGGSFDLRTNVFEKLDSKIFFESKPEDGEYIEIFGLCNNTRTLRWVRKDYVDCPHNFEKYKVFLPKAVGAGKFGEPLSKMLVGEPNVGHTQSFISIGNFDTKEEALNLLKYLKGKFSRCMLSILRVTQDLPPAKWKYVPIQDFTNSSDIDWSVSIPEIDRQLYKKYGLSEEEITFIENNVQEMT